jgi:lactose/L-arabinose transport system permease protein
MQLPIMITLATLLAVLLNSTLLQARGIMQFAFFAFVEVGEVAYAAVFRLMFSEELEIVNKSLWAVGLPEVGWFSNPTATALIIMAAT